MIDTLWFMVWGAMSALGLLLSLIVQLASERGNGIKQSIRDAVFAVVVGTFLSLVLWVITTGVMVMING